MVWVPAHFERAGDSVVWVPAHWDLLLRRRSWSPRVCTALGALRVGTKPEEGTSHAVSRGLDGATRAEHDRLGVAGLGRNDPKGTAGAGKACSPGTP